MPTRLVVAPLVIGLTLGLVALAGAQVNPLASAARNPIQRAVADVILAPGDLCPELATQFPTAGGARGDLRDRCTELVMAAGDPQVQGGLQAMAPSQWTVLGTSAAETALVTFSSISTRLASLRGRSGASGFGGLAFTDPEPSIRLASLASNEWLAATAPSASGAPLGRFGIFAVGHFGTGERDETGREAGFDFDAAGGTVGVDYRLLPRLIVGSAFTYVSTWADVAGAGGEVDSDDYSGSLYGTFYPTDALYLDGVLSVGITDYSIVRHIRYSVPGLSGGTTTVDQAAGGDTDAIWYAAGVTAGYDVTLGGFTVGPLVRLNYLRTEVDGYRERISGTGPGIGLALEIEDQTVESLTSELGVQASYAVSTPFAVLVPTTRAGWQHEFLDDARKVRARFQEDPSPSEATTITWTTDDPDRDFFVVAAGLGAAFRRGIAAFALYETVLGLRHVTEHRAAVGVRIEF